MPQYQCVHCGETHHEIPAFHADRPVSYWAVPEDKRETDISLTSDSCIIDNLFFFVHGCLEIPIKDQEIPFVWGVWVSLSEPNFRVLQANYDLPNRSHLGPFFGWLNSSLPLYPDTLGLKTMVHLRDNGSRPTIELEKTDHQLSREQRKGITLDFAFEMVHKLL